MKSLRVGLLGVDTSHVIEWSRRLNDSADPEHVPGASVTVAWAGGSPDFALSSSRVAGFTQQLQEQFGVDIFDSPRAVAEIVDLVFITAVDGRAHRALFREVIPFGKPTFIDKPMTTSLAEARDIFHIADGARVPVMSCSSLRFCDAIEQALAAPLGVVLGCDVYGPMPEEPTQPGLFWYGIHSVEIMNRVMGRGCAHIRAFRNESFDLTTAIWEDGRVATFRGTRKGERKFGCLLHREKGIQYVDLRPDRAFTRTLQAILAHLPHGTTAVAAEDTLEIIAIIEAANRSRQNGEAVWLCEV